MLVSEAVVQRFDELSSVAAYEELRRSLRGQCVSWKWATWPQHDLEPFFREKQKLPKGRWCKDEAADPRRHYRHGFDSEGRVLVIEESQCESFFVYSTSAQERVCFTTYRCKDGLSVTELVCVDRLWTENSIPIRTETLSSAGNGIREYLWEQGRLVLERCTHEDMEFDPGTVTYQEFTFEYNPLGRVRRITLEGKDSEGNVTGREVVYQRKKKGETLKTLSSYLQGKLVVDIREILTQAAIPEEVYCLLLAYDEENEPLPPWLALGHELERREIVAQWGDKAGCELWIPAQFPGFGNLQLTSSETVEASRLMNQMLIQRENAKPAIDLLNRVASDLAAQDWDGILNTTDDFVVIAVDLPGDDLLKNAKKSVSPALLKSLKAAHLM